MASAAAYNSSWLLLELLAFVEGMLVEQPKEAISNRVDKKAFAAHGKHIEQRLSLQSSAPQVPVLRAGCSCTPCKSLGQFENLRVVLLKTEKPSL